MNARSSQYISSWFLLIYLAGCGGAPREVLVPAEGVLEVDGKPLGGVRMTFAPANDAKGRGGLAITEDDGSFTVTHYTQQKPGIPAGAYLVTYSKFVMPDGTQVTEGVSPISVGAKEFFPIQWTRPASKSVHNLVTVPEEGAADLKIKVDSKTDPATHVPGGQQRRVAGQPKPN